MEVGQISDIFLTDFGYHIVKVQDRVPGGAAAFDEVKDQIGEHLYEQAKSHAIEAFLDDLTSKATIEKSEE
jgi:parvulin-like peptidyl-prolyl isomerase